MKVQTKIKIERFKIGCKKLCLVLLGIVIGACWFFVLTEGKEFYVSSVARDVVVIAPLAEASTAPTDTDNGVKEGEANGGQPATSLSIEEKIRITFPEEPDIMLAIAKAESQLNPHAINRANRNGSVDTGIFQINSIHGYDEEYLKNEDNNLKIAREIYEKQGITAWASYNNGAYLKWL